jgi:hypothetical protein
MGKALRRALARYWGYLLIPVIVWAWTTRETSYGPIAIASALSTTYFMFQTKVPCCAINRNHTFCRNNARGLLGGCHLRDHKWQNIRMLAHRNTWSQFAGGMFRRFEGRAATFAAMATCMSTLIAALALLVATYAFLDPRAPR